MLSVQQFLQEKGLEALEGELGIKVCKHDTKPLMILNYDQIESPKTHPVVRECRGLVLRADTFALVARSFPRFFNWGEVQDEMPLFNFGDFSVQSKEDGSLLMLFYFDGSWYATTRGSFGLGEVQFYDITWHEMVQNALNVSALSDLDALLDQGLTYVCELVGHANKVVRSYAQDKLYLLTAFQGEHELSVSEVDTLAQTAPFLRPTLYPFQGMEGIQDFLHQVAENDPTFEGVVIRDNENRRWKVKNPTYLALHRMRGEGDNLYHPKNLLRFLLPGELDELCAYFPEVREVAEQYKEILDREFETLGRVWETHKHLESQKEFALAILGQTPFTGILFNLRKEGKDGHEALRRAWVGHEAGILKYLMRQPRIKPRPN